MHTIAPKKSNGVVFSGKVAFHEHHPEYWRPAPIRSEGEVLAMRSRAEIVETALRMPGSPVWGVPRPYQ
jgi:hypothetical protein